MPPAKKNRAVVEEDPDETVEFEDAPMASASKARKRRTDEDSDDEYRFDDDAAKGRGKKPRKDGASSSQHPQPTQQTQQTQQPKVVASNDLMEAMTLRLVRLFLALDVQKKPLRHEQINEFVTRDMSLTRKQGLALQLLLAANALLMRDFGFEIVQADPAKKVYSLRSILSSSFQGAQSQKALESVGKLIAVLCMLDCGSFQNAQSRSIDEDMFRTNLLEIGINLEEEKSLFDQWVQQGYIEVVRAKSQRDQDTAKITYKLGVRAWVELKQVKDRHNVADARAEDAELAAAQAQAQAQGQESENKAPTEPASLCRGVTEIMNELMAERDAPAAAGNASRNSNANANANANGASSSSQRGNRVQPNASQSSSRSANSSQAPAASSAGSAAVARRSGRSRIVDDE
jgi:hypothetical protein